MYAQGVARDDDLLMRVDEPVVDEINAQTIAAFGVCIGHLVRSARDVAGTEYTARFLADAMDEHTIARQDAARDAAAPDISHRLAGGDTFGDIGQLWPRPFLGAPDQQEGGHNGLEAVRWNGRVGLRRQLNRLVAWLRSSSAGCAEGPPRPSERATPH